MRFILDENIPYSVYSLLKSLKYEVEEIRNSPLKGSPDKTITNYAKKKKAILVTKDLEFGNFSIYPKISHHGLIILRFPPYFTATQIADNFKNFLNNISIKDLIDSIIILELGKYRIRKISTKS